MYLTSYFTSPNQPQLLAQLRACEWGAAKFLTELLERNSSITPSVRATATF